ncbi:hypothetical protein [Sphingomonas albertensis]|uniref:hypothetical protein n=1 Tax=Sphingomonas albertensis TaxID=2762591 RepID=UPI0037DA0198
MSEDEAQALRDAIQATHSAYFGECGLSSDQWSAVDTLVAFAQRHLESPTSETDQLGGVGV